MRQPILHEDPGDGGYSIRNPVLHHADARELEYAADALRDRTMTLEQDEVFPAKKLLAVLIGLCFLFAVGAILFRTELKSFLGLV